jgi:hypothetical protein
MKLYNCDGYWKDTKEKFTNMIVCDGTWNGIEDFQDEMIFYYTDGLLPVVGEHDDFVIADAEEMV